MTEILDHARKLWNYHHVNHTIIPSDCIMVLGSHDLRVADTAVGLWHKGMAPLIVFSGHLGNFTLGVWERSEAEMLAERALSLGVPDKSILIENKAVNTGENVIFSKKLLEGSGIFPKRIIAVQKPFMERRVFATFLKFWPEIEIIVTSGDFKLEEYPYGEMTLERVIEIMVGDLQRILIYPGKGFQVYQHVPDDVMHSYNELIKAGYVGHMIS